MEFAAAKLMLPQTLKTFAVAYTTANTQSTLSTQARLTKASGETVGQGNSYLIMMLTTECRVAFGESAVTVDTTNDPPLPVGIYHGIAPAGFVGLRATAADGIAYFWIGS